MRTLKATGGSVAAADLVQVSRAIQLFLDPDKHVFLQALKPFDSAHFACAETSLIRGWVERQTSSTGVYFGINPAVEKMAGKFTVADVAYRRWILIDIDRNKTLCPNDPATENEHEDAKELAFEVLSYLGEVGFPSPIQVDSGNGLHLYYRINFTNDDTHRDLVHEFLKLLANTFNGDKGTIGEECFDARRISRMPGTWSRRGDASKERPYRQCRIVYEPKDVLEVPADAIRQIVAGDVKEAPDSPTPFELIARNGHPDRIKAYGARALDLECGKIAGTGAGQRNNQLFKSAAALFQLVAVGAIEGHVAKDALFIAANRAGLTNEDEVLGTIESAKKAGMSQPRKLPEECSNGKHEPGQLPERVIVLASEIEPIKIKWLWPGRVPLGMMTTFAGSGGLGKTFVLLDIACRVTKGLNWPDGTSGNKPGSVLYISGEDNPNDTLVPRLIAMGGDRTKIAFFKPEVLGKFTLREIPLIEKALDQIGKDCRLICVDPPTSFLAGTDDHKNSELRELLTPISQMAARRGAAIVFITHLNKGGAGKVDAVMRIIGSVAWSTAVRAAHMFCEDPDDDGRCLFMVAKINGAKRRSSLAYRIKQLDDNDVDGPATVEWLGAVDTTANEAVNRLPRKTGRTQAAIEWLRDKFKENLEWESEKLFSSAREENISRNAIFEAKREIGSSVTVKRTILANGTPSWVWSATPTWVNEQNNTDDDEDGEKF